MRLRCISRCPLSVRVSGRADWISLERLHRRCHDGDSPRACLAGQPLRGRLCTERLAQAGIDPSVGAVGDYDNALAETVIGLFKQPRPSSDQPDRTLPGPTPFSYAGQTTDQGTRPTA
jgi:hypothetical protein